MHKLGMRLNCIHVAFKAWLFETTMEKFTYCSFLLFFVSVERTAGVIFRIKLDGAKSNSHESKRDEVQVVQ